MDVVSWGAVRVCIDFVHHHLLAWLLLEENLLRLQFEGFLLGWNGNH
jgi:hypothetical protein